MMTHRQISLISCGGFTALLLAGALAVGGVGAPGNDELTPDDEQPALEDGVREAQDTAGTFSLNWSTVDGSGGTFVLTGTIGQPDAGDLAGGSFSLRGGFWQPAAPGAPPCPACTGDVNNDLVVNPFDLALLLGVWGNPGCDGVPPCCQDGNQDGAINPFDLALLLGNWGPCP